MARLGTGSALADRHLGVDAGDLENLFLVRKCLVPA